MDDLPELGFYGLAGHSATPRDLLAEVAEGERLGLGSVFLSERFTTKEAAALSGAAAAVSERIGIATAATNHNTRHPLLTATFATTLHRLSGGRFALGLGRGFDMLFDVMGLPRHLLRVVAERAVELVHGDEEPDAPVLEEVDGLEALLQAAGVGEHHGAQRAGGQLVPQEPEAPLPRRAEQVQHDPVLVDRDPAEVERDGGGGL